MDSTRRLITAAVLLWLTATAALAVPARCRWHQMLTADGTTVEATLAGDETVHFFTDRNGRQYALGNDGRLHPLTAERRQQMEQLHSRKAAERAARRLKARGALTRSAAFTPATAYNGELRQLIILVAFPDQEFADSSPATLWNKVLNSEGYDERPFRGSVRDYFRTQSYGQMDLVFDIHFVKADSSYTYYGQNAANGDEPMVFDLVREAVGKVAGEVSDWSVYDWNGDGEIEQVLLFYAGLGENDGGSINSIWPHQAWLDKDMTVDGGYKISSYGCFAELDSDKGYGTFGVLCHEYCHCLGLPDLYMTTSPFDYTVYSFSVLDHGCYNGDGYLPLGFSAFERYSLGWLQPKELTEPLTVSGMKPLAESGEAYIIRNSAWPDEFFMIENRQRTGWDRLVPDQGIVVWHIDYDEKVWWWNTVNNNTTRRRATIVPASNFTGRLYSRKATDLSETVSKWAYPHDGNDSLTENSKPAPVLYNPGSAGAVMKGKPLTDMAVDDNGLASFRFCGGNDASGIAAVSRQPAAAVKDVTDLLGRRLTDGGARNGLRLVRLTNGSVVKTVSGCGAPADRGAKR